MESSFIHKVALYIINNYNLKNNNLVVVFPNKRAAYNLREELRNNAKQTMWMPAIMSIEEAVTKWSGLELADKLDTLFELVAVDSELHNDRKKSISQFGGLAAQMASDFDEIDSFLVDAEKLFNYVTDDKMISIWDVTEISSHEKENDYIRFYKSLYGYYTCLRKRLLDEGKGYYGMITRLLAEDNKMLTNATCDSKIILAGFNALTASEEKMFRELVTSGIATTLWDFDNYYANDDSQNEAGIFARRLKKDYNIWFEHDFEFNDFGDNLLTKKRTINIIDSAGNTLQAKALQEQLSKSTDKNAAIVLVNEDLLIPVLNAIPKKDNDDCSIKVSMGYPIKMTAINGMTSLFFKLHRRRFSNNLLYIWPIFEILDLDIVKLTFDMEELHEISQWRKKKIKNEEYSINRDNIGFTENSDIERFVLLMTSKAENVTELVESLKQAVALIGWKAERRKDDGNNFIKAQIDEIHKSLVRIEEIIKKHSDIITENEAIESLFHVISGENTISLSSKDTDKKSNCNINIMGLLETRNLDFETMHLIGANEGVLPKNNSKGSFIPYFIRSAMNMPTNEKKQAVYAYHFYRLLQNCEHVFIYYNSDNEAEGDMSRFVMQIERELVPQSNGNTKINTLNFVSSNVRKETLSSPISIPKTQDIIEKLKEKLKNGMAPTTLQKYVACPLKFCFTYVFNISDNEEDENVQANQIGTKVHNDVLEEAFKKAKKDSGQEDYFIDSKQLDIIRTYAKENIDNLNLQQNGYNYLNKEIIRNFAMNYLKSETGNFYLIGTEMKLSKTIFINDVVCELTGTIDRIDRLMDGTIRICDYKTDKKIKDSDLKVGQATKKSKDNTTDDENNIPDEGNISHYSDMPEKARQLLIYKYLYMTNNNITDANKVTASIIGLTGHSNPYHELQINDTQYINDFLGKTENLLTDLLKEILNPEIPFNQTTEKRNCQICDFKDICCRD